MKVPITPVELALSLSNARSELWIKRDDLSDPLYGGNKARKMPYLLEDARARGKSRLVTVGPVGSHHVLATALLGGREGFEVAAVLTRQPRSEHVVATARAIVASASRVITATRWANVPYPVLAEMAAGAHYVSIGGSDVSATRGYVEAARELATQVKAGLLPEPHEIVVALGSGGTAAGLAAGVVLAGLRARVIAVSVATPVALVAHAARRLTHAVLRAVGEGAASTRRDAIARLEVEPRFLGDGYGIATAEGERAMARADAHATATAIGSAASADVELAASAFRLEATYTAKAFACALARADAGRARTILYWHTVSGAPLAPVLAHAPSEAALAPDVRALLR